MAHIYKDETPEGDENRYYFLKRNERRGIYKDETPEGDENPSTGPESPAKSKKFIKMRPRKGTKTLILSLSIVMIISYL